MQLIHHLKLSALQLFPPLDGKLDRRHGEYLESLQAESHPSPVCSQLSMPIANEALILSAADSLLRAEQFDTGAGPDYDRATLDATFNQQFSGQEDWLAWVPRSVQALHLALRVHIEVDSNGLLTLYTSANLPTWVGAFRDQLTDALNKTPAELNKLFQSDTHGDDIPHDLLLGPGERLTGPFSGMLLDYSGCATAQAVSDLTQGDLPLGRYAFGLEGRGVNYGRDLYLSKFRTGAPMIYNGALICAPQNSGKTRLIIRWALAANRQGMNVLLVDVKGNLYHDLARCLNGEVYHFSTDPELDECDGVNFLNGLHGHTPANRMHIRQLVEALLPKEGWEAGEQAYFHQNHTNWLTGLIQILLLYRDYYPEHFVDGEPDLSIVYDMASDEAKLYRMLDSVRAKEDALPPAERVSPGIAYWMMEISLLIDPNRGGQRTSDYSYRTLTQSITNALRPFSQFGTLYSKTSKGRVVGTSQSRRFFSFDVLNKSPGPVTVILAAREQDIDDASTVVSMVVKRLQHTLFERMKPEHADKPPIVLLLDETRRIRSFSPDEYITFARQARAGCVIVYQSLDQIGDDKKIRIILENVGTQIYLGSLVGESARHFIQTMPKRRRPTFSYTTSRARGEASVSTQTGYESVDYLSAAELYRLPAGQWPALVYVNAQPRRDPILVDMAETGDIDRPTS